MSVDNPVVPAHSIYYTSAYLHSNNSTNHHTIITHD